MAENILIEALDQYIEDGHQNERQLANLAKDLIQLAGDDPRVIAYLNMKTGSVMNEESAWD